MNKGWETSFPLWITTEVSYTSIFSTRIQLQAHKFLTRANLSGFVPTYVKTLELSSLKYCKKKKKKERNWIFWGIICNHKQVIYILVSNIHVYQSQQTPASNNTREKSTHGHHQMVSIRIRLIIFFAAKDREALQSQQKQDQELTVAQIMNSLLPNSDLNWRK